MTAAGSNRTFWQSLPFTRFLSAGMLAGLAAALLNVCIYLFMIGFAGHAWSILVAVSILAASLLPNLVAAVAFFFLVRFVRPAHPVLTIGIVIFVLASILPHLGIGPAPSPALHLLPEGFTLLTVPLHLVFGLSGIVLMPRLLSRRRQAD